MGGNTTVYKYDKGGNLQFKKIYAYSTAYGKTFSELLNGTSGKTVNYGYGNSENKDLLTSYNGSGTLAYNGYGNPEKWFKHGTNGSSLAYTLQWGLVSNLITITDDDTQDIYTYIYNDQGIRTEKIINDVSHKYYLQGEQIIAERYGNKLIKFYYDGTGVCGFNYNGTDYYYQKNIQGDILKVFNGNGTLYAEYSYDAWGKCAIKTNVSGIAAINPFRYRGYYLDDETGLYYLNARYYDPEIGRFISADSIAYLAPESINGLNVYAYCGNNSVMNVDPTGTWSWSEFWTGLGQVITGIAAVVAGALVIASGVAGIAMLVVAGITIVAGSLTLVNGAANIGEAFSNYNFMRDGVFKGNETAYNWFSGVTEAVAVVGTMICGGWLKHNAPRIEAYKNIDKYSFSDTISDATHIDRPFQQSTLLQKQIIKYGKMINEGNGVFKFIAKGAFRIGFEGSVHSNITCKLVVNIIKDIIFHMGPF